MFYERVNLGSLEDTLDARRQSMRAAMLFSTLAIFSERNATYYLDLALHHLETSDGAPIEFLERQYVTQYLVCSQLFVDKDLPHVARQYLNRLNTEHEALVSSLDESDPLVEAIHLLDRYLPKLNK